MYRFFPFLAYLAIHYKDDVLKERIKYSILSLKPSLINESADYIDHYLLNSYERINWLIDTELKQMPLDDYLYIGFSTQFNQWIIANIIIDRIRKIKPDTIFIAGGCGTQKEARALLRNFTHYQYVSWGEGEYSLLQLTRFLDPTSSGSLPLEKIPHIVYLQGQDIVTSDNPNVYVDLDQSLYDYTDYFEQLKSYPENVKPRLPVEKGRGCHWRRCRFCFSNAGYKFRAKTPEVIIHEMDMALKKYPIQQFIFVDNDIIANDIEGFNKFLDLLIELRANHRPFQIVMAEVITKNITSFIIEKMMIAGLKKIQIGYESPSDRLLAKINKKNTFASNLLCIKWGLYYGIKFGGVNVIRNLLEETDEDIKEGIGNLYFLRFFLSKESFFHRMSFLAVATNSRYFHRLKPIELESYESELYSFLPSGYVREEDKYTLIVDSINPGYNELWNVFTAVQTHYLQNIYTYKLMCTRGLIYYREFYNSQDTKELEFDGFSSIHWRVLEACNHKVRSLGELEKEIAAERLSEEESLAEVVDSLKEEGILYCNQDRSEIVSIINTDMLVQKSGM